MIRRLIGVTGLMLGLLGGVAIAAPVPNAPENSETVFWDSYDVAGGTVKRYIANESGWQYVDQTLYASLYVTMADSSTGIIETQLVQANCDSGQARTFMRAINLIGSQSEASVAMGRPDSWYGLREGSPMVQACSQARASLAQSRSMSAYSPAPPTPTNLYTLDGNANVRSGASGESGVMLNTSRASTVTVHSWNGDWAWITTTNGVDGWTHRVNLTKI